MGASRILACAFLAGCLSAAPAAAQTAGVAISGPNPWIDPTAPIYGAKCDGLTDDTRAIQKALNAVLQTGSTLFIPPTVGGCVVAGATQQIASISNSGGTVTAILSGSLQPNFPTQVGPPNPALVNIHTVPNGSNGTVFNGTYVLTLVGKVSGGSCVSGTGGTPCITYTVSMAGPDSEPVPNGYAEIGLYFSGNNLKVLGAAAGSGAPNSSGSQLSTSGGITILTTLSTANPLSGPDIQNVDFVDTSSMGAAYAGLNIGTASGFSVSNNGFSGFNGGAAPAVSDPQGGAAIVTVGNSGFVQFGKIENNHIHAKIGFTSKFQVSSVTFDSNQVQCTGSTPQNDTIGLDIGGVWYPQ
jgi:hypothetical protein